MTFENNSISKSSNPSLVNFEKQFVAQIVILTAFVAISHSEGKQTFFSKRQKLYSWNVFSWCQTHNFVLDLFFPVLTKRRCVKILKFFIFRLALINGMFFRDHSAIQRCLPFTYSATSNALAQYGAQLLCRSNCLSTIQ